MIDALLTSADYSIAACFVLAALFLRVRESLVCIVCLAAFHLIFELSSTGFQVHILMAGVNAVATYFCVAAIARVFMLFAVFQYIMAIDAFMFPNTSTVLYEVYPIVTFALNLMLLAYLGKGKRFDAIQIDSFFGIFRRWSAIISRMAKH